MIFLPKFDVEQVFKYLPQATAMMGVPTFYTRLLADERLNRERTAHMRLFTSGSAPLLAETHRAFEERTGQRILERYGMTETNMSTSNPYDGERRAGTVGFPLPGVEIRDRRCGQRQAAARWRDRRHRGQGSERLLRLLADAGEDRRRIPRRRLLHHRRPRPDRSARLCHDRRPRQGPDHLRRLQHLPQGGRAGARRTAGRCRKRRGRRAAS